MRELQTSFLIEQEQDPQGVRWFTLYSVVQTKFGSAASKNYVRTSMELSDITGAVELMVGA